MHVKIRSDVANGRMRAMRVSADFIAFNTTLKTLLRALGCYCRISPYDRKLLYHSLLVVTYTRVRYSVSGR
jgi:phospholipase/lecithinase/hemolysin